MRAICICSAVVALLLICSHQPANAEPPPKPEYQLVLQTPPAASVNSVAVSADGALVGAAGGEGGVRLYDAKSGRLLRAIGESGDRNVVFSPDGRTLTVAGFHMDKLVSLWDVQTGKRLRTFAGQTEWEADATAISPDGKLLASTGVDKQVLVWEVVTGKLRHQLKDQPYRIAALAFSPDSAALAGGGGDKLVRIWDMASGKLRRSLAGHRDWICTLAFSPDGRQIASGSCDWGFHRGHDWPRPPLRGIEQSEWRLWNVDSGQLERAVTERGQILSLAIAPDGKSLVCGVSKEVRLYDLSSKAPGRVLPSHDAEVTSVAFTPDGAAVISGSHDQTVKRTNLASGKIEWQAQGYFEQVNSVAISDDGSLLVTGSGDHRFARERLAAGSKPLGPGAVRLWDMKTGRLLRRLGDAAEQVMAIAVSADGRLVAAGGASTSSAGSAHVWDAASGAALWSTSDHGKEVLAICFAPDGKSVATGAADGVVKIRDAQTGRITRTLTGHKGGATSLVYAPDGQVLYCGEGNGGSKSWEVTSGHVLRVCKAGESKAELFTVDRRMNSIGLSRDGKILATCASSVNNEFVDPVRIWDAGRGTLLREFAADKTHGRPMALSPDGALVATGGKSIKLWDVRTGKMLRELFGHLKRTQSTVFSADGRLIVSGGSYGTTNIWEVATGKHLVTLFAFRTDAAIADDWLAYAPGGHYDGSTDIERYLAWRVGDELKTPDSIGVKLRQPDIIAAALRLEPSAADRALLVPASVWFVAAADLNGDGRPDAVATHTDGGSDATILINDGQGKLSAAPGSPLQLGHGAWGAEIADMNRDGKADLIFAAGDDIRLLLGDGRGGFKPAAGSPFATGKGAWRLKVADFNGDGKPDVATPCVDAGQITILYGN